MRITSAQLNQTVGDIDGNVRRIITAARQASAEGAHLMVTPELSLTGYYPGDLLEDAAFLRRVDDGLQVLLAASCELPALHWVIGAPMPRSGPGKRLFNTLLVIRDGEVLLRYAKQLLPTYNVFHEHRHFEPGPDVARVLRIDGRQVGLMVCEDGWNDSGLDYAVNPFTRLADAAPDLIVSINASPSNINKREQRHALFSAASRRHNLAVLFVNQVGGQDQVVFDGASFAVEPERGVVFEAPRFVEDVTTIGFNDGGRFTRGDGSALPPVDAAGLAPMAFYRAQIVLGLRDYARRCGFGQAVVGCSGGIDSALTLALAAEALGPDNVVAITMPSRHSSAGSTDDSALLCRNLGVRLETHPIQPIVDAFAATFEGSLGTPLQGLPMENLQARVRGSVLMAYSNRNGHLLLTTGNKSEISVGYCTLYGDTNGGLGLIGDLYKTEVFALARHLNEAAGRDLIPRAIIDKEPSAELAPDQKDTDSLPPYELLDELLKLMIEGPRLAPWEFETATQVTASLQADAEGRALIAKVRGLIARNEYKRHQAPPIIRLRALAFGSGRQIPISAFHGGLTKEAA